MSTRLVAERLTGPVGEHTESPYWDEAMQRVVWVDMLAGRVLVTSLDGVTRAVSTGDPVAAFVRPLRGGGHVVVGERSLGLLDLAEDDPTPSRRLPLPVPQGSRANDGAAAPDGSLLVGTMAYDVTPGAGQVLRVLPDGSCRVALDGTTISNGLHAADGHVLFVDSPTRELARYLLDEEGTWGERDVVADCGVLPGDPDGLCVDADGGVWVAHWDGGCVARYDSSSGAVTHRVDLPVARPTACALAGPAGDVLVVTTSTYGRRPGTDPDAGSLFAVQVPAPGPTVLPCGLEP